QPIINNPEGIPLMATVKSSGHHIVSKKRGTGLRLTATALSSAMLMASPALIAAEQTSERKTLSPVKVEADAIQSSYKAEQVSSPKFTQPLLDTPQTIQVITNQVFTQQGATTL